MDFNCDSCGKPFQEGDTVTNVGDEMEVILICEACDEPVDTDSLV